MQSNGTISVSQEFWKKKREKEAEGILEQIIAENFPNLGKETGIQVQEGQRTPLIINKNRLIPQHITVKLEKYKDKGRNLKATRDKRALTYKGRYVRLASHQPMKFSRSEEVA